MNGFSIQGNILEKLMLQLYIFMYALVYCLYYELNQ